jgi:epoxyqueuosine reductase
MSVRPPVSNGISIQFCRHISQDVCPWNVKFARPGKEPRFAAREVISDKDATTLATEILAMSDDRYRAAFKGSAMKRAKPAGLRRNAAAVLRAVPRGDPPWDDASTR